MTEVFPNGVMSLFEEVPPREDEAHLILILKSTDDFYEKFSNLLSQGSTKNNIRPSVAVNAKEESKDKAKKAVQERKSNLNLILNKLKKTDTELTDEQKSFLVSKMELTQNIKRNIKETFEDLDKYQLMLLDKIIENQAKENSENFKKQELQQPEDFYYNSFTKEVLKMPYYEFTYEDYILIVLRVVKFFTSLNIRLEMSDDKKLYCHLFADEPTYNLLAEHFDYDLQLKPYALKYQIFLNKNKCADETGLNHTYSMEHEDHVELNPQDKRLEENLQIDELNIDNPFHWPPYTCFESMKALKFRRYEKDDTYHECVKDPEWLPEVHQPVKTENFTDISHSECCSKFRNIDRIRLIHRTVDENLKISSLIKQEIIESVNYKRNFISYGDQLSARSLLWESSNIFNERKQMKLINTIRNFFGEKVSFYFLWLLNLNIWLIFPGILGIVLTIISMSTGKALENNDVESFGHIRINYYDISLFVFSFVITVWATLFLKIWKQKEKLFTYFWGMESYQQNEPDQESFEPDKHVHFIFDQKVPLQSKAKQRFKKFLAYLVVGFMIALTIFLVYLLFKLKASKTNGGKVKSLKWSIIIASINAVLIKVMSIIYEFIAKRLTLWENHEKHSQMESSLAIKIVMFEFVNNYFPIYYIGFVKPYTFEFCVDNNCLKEIQIQLYTTMFVKVLINIVEIGLPLLKHHWKKRNYIKNLKQKLNLPEETEIIIAPHSHEHQMLCDDFHTFIYEYNEVIILFGYVCFFSVAAPLTPLIIFVLTYMERFVDSYKIFYLQRVLIISGSSGIEIYNSILKVFYFMGMLTNVALVLFTNPNLINVEEYQTKSLLDNNDFIVKIIIFALLENLILIMIGCLNYNILPKCKIFKLNF